MNLMLYIAPLIVAMAWTLWCWWLIDVEDVADADHG
jgi:hypothetical protein